MISMMLLSLTLLIQDMVGHTGVDAAAIKAVEAVDECVKNVVNKVLEKDGDVFITADHGNAEVMMKISQARKSIYSSHYRSSTICLGTNYTEGKALKDGKLADIAPTMLNKLGLEVPAEMTGENLIINK